MDNFTRHSGRWSKDNITTEYDYYHNHDNVHYDQEYLDFRQHVQMIADILIIIRIIICSFGAALNLSSVIILIKIRWRGKPIFKLILSLAVSDMLLAVLHFIFIFIAVPTIWTINCISGFQTCSVRQTGPILSFVYIIPQTAGLVNMFSLAVDLLLAVKKPFRHRELMSGRRVNILIICTWVVPAIFALATGIGDIYLRQEYNFLLEGILGIPATALIVVLSNVSFFVFVILYLVIYCGIRSAMANFPRQHTNNLRKATVTTLLIVVTYAICMTPVTLGTLIVVLDYAFMDRPTGVMMYAMTEIVQTLFVLNTVLDPLIYAIRIREVRETYTGILCRCRRRRQGGSSVDGT